MDVQVLYLLTMHELRNFGEARCTARAGRDGCFRAALINTLVSITVLFRHWRFRGSGTTIQSMNSFLDMLLRHHDSWRNLPASVRSGEGWRGVAITVPPPPGSDLAGPLDIEETSNEVTISLDYSHIHLEWPPVRERKVGGIWLDPLAVIEAILREQVVSTSGWSGERLRFGSLHELDKPTTLRVPDLQRIRVRSWNGTFDRDDVFTKAI